MKAAALGLAAALLLAGCASKRPSPALPTEAETPAPPRSPHPAFEQAQREQAAALARQGRLFEAAITWEVLLLLRPDLPEYRDKLAQVRQAIDAGVAERMQRAVTAQRRGDAEAASAQYLAALALQPDNAAAADALRSIERERNKRLYLGKPSRLTLTRRAIAESEMAPDAAAASNDREHASLLAGQGEIDEAIKLLERRVAAGAKDEPVRRALADLYYRKAQSIPAGERPQAIALLRKGIALDPANGDAAALLRQLQTGVPKPPGAPAP